MFGDNYLGFISVSLVLHAANSTLLYSLLRRLAGPKAGGSGAALLLAFFFLVSSLHVETLQQAIIQNNLLCETFILASVLAALRYLERGSRLHLAATAAACFAAPLAFALGFAAPFQLLLAGLVSPYGRKRLGASVAAGIAGALAAAVLYAANPNLAPEKSELFDPAGAFGSIGTIAAFTFVGTQLGTVLRGTGLFPFVQIVAPREILGDTGIPPELLLAGAGFALSLLLLLPSASRRYWVAGQLWMLSCLALPALGRWQMGAEHSLFPRYQYGALIGFAIVLLPFFMRIFAAREKGEVIFGRALLPACLVLFLFVQLSFGRAFSFFSTVGNAHRLYAAQLAERSEPPPAYPVSLAPHSSPEQIYATLHWLNPQRYP